MEHSLAGTARRRVSIVFADLWKREGFYERRTTLLEAFLARRFDLVASRRPDVVVYSCFGYAHLKHDATRLLYLGEPVRPDMHECDFAFSFDPESDRNYRLPLFRLYPEYERMTAPRDAGAAMKRQTKFCGLVSRNAGAPERWKMFDRLQRYKPVDSGGPSSNTLGRLVDDKVAFLQDYKFSIAFENTCYPGYTTEKLLHALAAGTIPIYWGNPLVAQDFNPRAFINGHDFQNWDEVVERVREIDRDDDLRRRYLAEPCFVGGKEPEFLREDRIFDRFEAIFATPARRRSRVRPDLVIVAHAFPPAAAAAQDIVPLATALHAGGARVEVATRREITPRERLRFPFPINPVSAGGALRGLLDIILLLVRKRPRAILLVEGDRLLSGWIPTAWLAPVLRLLCRDCHVATRSSALPRHARASASAPVDNL